MNPFDSELRSVAAILAMTFAATCAHATGFQRGLAADPEGKPLELSIWCPSAAATTPVSMGATTMSVAINAPFKARLGRSVPLRLTTCSRHRLASTASDGRTRSPTVNITTSAIRVQVRLIRG